MTKNERQKIVLKIWRLANPENKVGVCSEGFWNNSKIRFLNRRRAMNKDKAITMRFFPKLASLSLIFVSHTFDAHNGSGGVRGRVFCGIRH
jgi:hypothetical protein